MRKQYKHLVFISAQTSFRHDQSRHDKLMIVLQRYGFSPTHVNGSYKGETEKTYMVQITDESQLDLFTRIGKSFDQHSILYRDNENNCELVYCKNSLRERIGQLNQICPAHRGQYDNYTELNGKFYSTRG